MSVISATTDSEILECWPVISQLRLHLKREEFLPTVRRQIAEGYRLVFIRREGGVAALAGFRVMHNLAWGRFCYVDDLVTDAQTRSQGLGAELMDWVCDVARSEGCCRVELDSGVQRFEAHRFYFREKMAITCYHFSREFA